MAAHNVLTPASPRYLLDHLQRPNARPAHPYIPAEGSSNRPALPCATGSS